MKSPRLKIAGVIPAAGNASRISPIPCSKEILQIGFQSDKGEIKIKVAASHLLEAFYQGGADQIYMIIQKGKWDIPQYFGTGAQPENLLAYIVTEPTPGTHYTIDLAYKFAKDSIVLLGFPDILFKPKNAFVSLLDKQKQTGADVVLGLFKATNPNGADMVEIDDQGRLKNIVIKPLKTELEYTWTIAVWTPVFSEYLHDFVSRAVSDKSLKSDREQREVFIGDVILDALEYGLKIETVLFPDGNYIDIGTIPDLKRALNTDW